MRLAITNKHTRRLTSAAIIGIVLALMLGLTFTGNVLAVDTSVRQPHAAGVEKRAIVRGGGADLREAPGGKIVKSLPLGTAVTAVGRTADDTWIKIDVDDQTSGWVRLDELVLFGMNQLPVLDVEVIASANNTASGSTNTRPVSQTQVDTTAPLESPAGEGSQSVEGMQTATVSTPSRPLNVRKGPGTNFAVVGSLRSGTKVTALARNARSSWIQIQIPDSDNIGWVSAAFVELSGDPVDLSVSEEQSTAPTVRSAATRSTRSGGDTGLKGKLVFQEKSGGKINMYNLENGSLRTITSGMDPAISPDGKTVAFVRSGGEDQGIYLIDIDGNNERRIYSGGSGLRSPSWSPDGTQIVFARTIGYTNCRDVGFGFCIADNPYLKDYPLKQRPKRGLSVMDTQGGNFRDISSLDSATAPNWNEGGIVYSNDAGIEITGPDFDTYSVAAEHRYQDPNWQPGNGRIVFHSLEKDHREIFIVNPDGNGLTALTRPATTLVDIPVQNVAPIWSPDGKYILFLSNRGGAWAFYVMNADGSNLRKLQIDTPLDYGFQVEQTVSWGI